MVRMARTARADSRAGGPELPKIRQAALERKRLRRGPAVPGGGEGGLRGNDGIVGFADERYLPLPGAPLCDLQVRCGAPVGSDKSPRRCCRRRVSSGAKVGCKSGRGTRARHRRDANAPQARAAEPGWS